MLYQMTLYMSVTALVILIFKMLFKNKLSAKFHVLIWLLLFVRMFAPILPESTASVFNAVSLTERTRESNAAYTADNAEYNGTIAADEPIHASKQDKTASAAELASFIWLLGVCAMLAHFTFTYINFSRKISKLPQNCDRETADIMNECANTLGIRRKVPVYNGKTPMLKGIFSPIIIMPENLSESEKRAAIMHELCHLKHNDILLLWISMLILALNWFNPIIWYSFFTFRKDIEIYCDSRALNYIGNKKEYAGLLLKTALKNNRFVSGTTALQNGEKEVSKRIKRIAYFKRPKAVWTAAALLAAAAIAFSCLTNAFGNYKLKDIRGYCNNIVGAIMADLDYADSEKVVFHYLNGFFVYNQSTDKLDVCIDLSKMKIAPHQQGSNGLTVKVDKDGRYAYLSSYGPKDEIKGLKDYVINLSDGSVRQGNMPKNTELFDKFSQTYDAVTDAKGWFSDLCVRDNSEVYYLTDEETEIGALKLVTLNGEKYVFSEYYSNKDGDKAANTTPLYMRTEEELASEFKRVYTPYYDIQNLEISNWQENGNEAKFFYKMTYLNYIRDVSKVDYLNKAKNTENYEKLCEDYLSEHESNYEFKVELTGDENNPLSSVGVLKLYTNIDPHGEKWERVKVDDFILGK